MDSGIPHDGYSPDGLLKALQISSVVAVFSVAGLLVWGRSWVHEANAVTPLSLDLQRNEVVLRSLLAEAYQWNQKARNPELEALFRQLNVTVQPVSPTGGVPGAAPGAPPPARR